MFVITIKIKDMPLFDHLYNNPVAMCLCMERPWRYLFLTKNEQGGEFEMGPDEQLNSLFGYNFRA
jgi:hypothetical protein